MEIIAPGVKVDQTNFETCIYRSKDKFIINEQACCGKAPVKTEGYQCKLFAINGITATTCVNCTAYHGKKSN